LAGEDARLKAGLKSAEDELNLIKNQIQQTLLDIREHILDVTNPFNSVVPEMLDDDEEEMTIEDAGGDAGGGDAGGGDEIIEEGDGEGADDLESLEDSLPPEEEILSEDGGMMGDEYEDVPGDEVIDDGGGSGGLMDMLEPEEEEEEDLDEDFELDEEEPETPEFEADIEEEEQMEPVLPSDELPIDPEEPMTSGDGVADAVAAALAADVDLLTMASLVRWTAVTRERIGANRLDILLDAYELAGRISPQMKNVVRTLSMLGDEDADGIPVKDIVTAMVRMEGVLNSDENRESNRLLGLLLEMDDDPLDRLAA
jgi:hypothetical protein